MWFDLHPLTRTIRAKSHGQHARRHQGRVCTRLERRRRLAAKQGDIGEAPRVPRGRLQPGRHHAVPQGVHDIGGERVVPYAQGGADSVGDGHDGLLKSDGKAMHDGR